MRMLSISLVEFNGGRARDPPTAHSQSAQETEKLVFTLPLPNQDQRRVFAYLQKRGIAPPGDPGLHQR